MKLSAADERTLQRLLDVVGEHVDELEDEIRRALRQGRTAAADRAYERASELRRAFEDAGAVLARFGVTLPALALRPSEPL